jgi:ABC-type transport system substrate-binding protein
LSKIGVTMNIMPITYALFARYYTQGGWKGEALLADYPISSLDALRSFYRSAHSCDWPAAWYCDRAIQSVIDAAGIEPDIHKRTAMTRRVLRHYHDTAQSLLLFPILGLDALGPRITAWEPWNDIIQYHKLDVAE